MKVLVIIPAYNEEENIARVVDKLINEYPQYDYIVVNDGSADRTGDICRENNYSYIDLPVNLGLAGAFQTGMKYALKYDYDCAIQYEGMDSTDRSISKECLNCLRTKNWIL